VFTRNDKEPNTSGSFVLYWMQINRRFQYNYALEYAVGWANKLGKPLLIVEDLICDYPWASERFHTFLMEGMTGHLEASKNYPITYCPFVEDESGQVKEMFDELVQKACVVISDEFPVFIMQERNRQVPHKLNLPYYTVDSNGLIPLKMTEKAPYNAYFFRKTMQKLFVEAYTHPPKENPLGDLKNGEKVKLPEKLRQKYENSKKKLRKAPEEIIGSLDIRHDIKPLNISGTRKAAISQLDLFINNGILKYDKLRNHPDEDGTSRISPWLHFGKISEYEIVKEALNRQPKGWDLDSITYNNGSSGGFFNGDENIDSFLDEVITWREAGFHFAFHTPYYDAYESLPDWALKTLDEHRDDPRSYIYSFEELETAQTHDPVWNAAQRQLRQEGIIHNYMRMLWGKKVIMWTPDPETALQYLIELNNRYAIDGRDPNSYSGIFWCFGRFDRPWQEREILGKVRYMTSDSARKKLRLEKYLKRYGKSLEL